MTYLCWAALYEGATDSAYFEVMLYRLMEDIVSSKGVRPVELPALPALVISRSSNRQMAIDICKSQDSFHVIFVHADTGGRGLETSVSQRSTCICSDAHEHCGFPKARCITVTPRHEVEAWVLADPQAVTAALGYTGSPASIDLPSSARAAERTPDPKRVLQAAAQQVRGRRRPPKAEELYAAVAQRQNFSTLRLSRSFADFEERLEAALRDLGIIE